MTKILFVCLGNICRSPGAEGVLKDIIRRNGNSKDIYVDSAGTGRWHIGQLPDPRMRRAAGARGIKLDHHCRQVCDADFDDFDYIIGMDANNIADLRRLAPSVEAEAKIHHINEWMDPASPYDYVPDPYYEGQEGFTLVLDLLEDACHRLYNQLS